MMRNFLIAAVLTFPLLAHSQAIPFDQHRVPLGSFTASASYIYGEAQNNRNKDTSLWGWSVVPEVNLTHHIGLQAELANYYMQDTYPGQNRFLVAAGPRYTFAPRSRFTPFVFAEGGEIRITSQKTLYRDWDTIAKAGVGFEYRLSPDIALTVVPGEYLAHNLDWGPWQQDFTARAGITFNVFR